jgi:D-inositol-3-phosphate glycosyltransferase
VAADVGGLSTLVDHGRTGLLVDNRDPAAFAHALARVLDDPGAAEAMGVAAAARAGRYTWSTTGARLRRLYGDLTARSLVECR